MTRYRLPQTVLPSRYELRLEPDLAAAAFRGRAAITIQVKEPVAEVLLNAAELAVDEAALVDGSGHRQPARVELLPEDERCRLVLPGQVGPGEYQLQLAFQGTLNDKLHGLYRSSYKNSAGETRWLAATQFEATDARRAFPCWDEPAFKAVFSCTLVIDPALTAISNTAVVEEGVVGGKKVVRFADTIPLPTYLVAFIVGELEATESTQVGRTPLRVWCVPGKRPLAAFGQEIGAASLAFFESYYQRSYPGDKLDLLAIPDFAAGAMENFGAVTFRETALLVDEKAATHGELERVADVVAHENAHMWFGDLVTMGWWNGLWLNEAFATFMGMSAVDHWRPEWQRWTSFGISRATALLTDGLNTTRPIEFPVEAPRDAEAMFDVLTYQKGAAVLRMLESYLGTDQFRAGVRLYLERHAFGNTETGDLWVALGDASGQPIPQIMDGWIFHPGYPLLSVRRDGQQLHIVQRRFRYLQAEGAEERLWQVPVAVRVQTKAGSETRRLLLADAETALELPPDCEAVLVNEGGHAFVRVAYTPELLQGLLPRLGTLSDIERFNLLGDSWAAVLAGLAPLRSYLDLTGYFRGERNRNVWLVLLGSCHELQRIVQPEDYGALAALVRDRLHPAFTELGWVARPGESEVTRQLRGDLIRALGTLGDDPAVQEQAQITYARYLADPAQVDMNVVAAVIPVLAHTGDQARYERFLHHFQVAATPQEEQRYLYALAGFRPPFLVEETLKKTVNGVVRTQDVGLLLRSMLHAVHSREAAWRFVQANWQVLGQKLPSPVLKRMYEGVTGLATPQLEQEVNQLFEANKIDLGGKVLAQILEQLRILIRLREREGEELHSYLEAIRSA